MARTGKLAYRDQRGKVAEEPFAIDGDLLSLEIHGNEIVIHFLSAAVVGKERKEE